MGALVLSALNKDYAVNKLVTIVDAEKESKSIESKVSPIAIKIMIDHSIRTHIPIEYKIVDKNKKILFQSKNIQSLLPFYKPEKIIIDRFIGQKPEKNFVKEKLTDPLRLKKYALWGLERNFPSYNSASGYGTALATKTGKIYFGGQYSSPDKSLSLHSEVTTILSALANRENKITHIGIVSTKHLDSPCDMCGICRQFISEMASKLKISPKLYCFAKDTDEYRSYSIEEYLPSSWTSKNWKQNWK